MEKLMFTRNLSSVQNNKTFLFLYFFVMIAFFLQDFQTILFNFSIFEINSSGIENDLGGKLTSTLREIIQLSKLFLKRFSCLSDIWQLVLSSWNQMFWLSKPFTSFHNKCLLVSCIDLNSQ